jgi:hypothetical protein
MAQLLLHLKSILRIPISYLLIKINYVKAALCWTDYFGNFSFTVMTKISWLLLLSFTMPQN